MKKIGQLFMLFAVSLLALSACGNENNEPVYGKIEYDGKTFEINMAECLNIASMPTGNPAYFDYFILANIEKRNDHLLPYINCRLDLKIGDPRESFEFELGQDSGIAFACDGGYYSSSKFPVFDPESDLWAVKSYGIDPTTGKEIYNNTLYESGITGGRIKWTAGENSAKLEFNLTLKNGKTAKGSATVPYSVFKKSL